MTPPWKPSRSPTLTAFLAEEWRAGICPMCDRPAKAWIGKGRRPLLCGSAECARLYQNTHRRGLYLAARQRAEVVL